MLGVLNTLATCALRISNEKNLDKGKYHMLNVFTDNGYSRHQGLIDFLKAGRSPKVKKDPKDRISRVHLPIIHGTTENILRILMKHNVPSTFWHLNTIISSLGSVKDPVDPDDKKGVYVIPCFCGTPYVGDIGCSIDQRIHDHVADIKHTRSKHTEKARHHICIEEG